MSENWHPHEYQKRAIRFLIGQACGALFLDPGLGKTSIMLSAFKILKAKSMARRMLVIAPLRPAQTTWPNEKSRWREFVDLRMVVLHDVDKQWANVFENDISVINPEGLPWLLKSIHGEWPWDVLCVDESTQFKHTGTQRFRFLRPTLEKFRRRYILTGSPAPNGLLDLFGQIFILDLGNALGRYVSWYRDAYFTQHSTNQYLWLPKPDAAVKIEARLAPLVLRMEAKDYLDLPPLIHNKVEIELPREVMRVYRLMEDQFFAEINDDKVIALNQAAAGTKCRQIANGGIYGTVTRGELVSDDADGKLRGPDGERLVHHLHKEKVDAVEEIINELSGKPALVAYEFDHDRDRLLKRFGPDTPWIGGGVAAGRFRDIESMWNAGALPILLAQPQTIAHGLNLQGTGAAIIKASLTWDLEKAQQFVQRVWRQGQKDIVFVHDIVAKNTIDEVIYARLKQKDKTQRGLLDAFKEYSRRRRI